MNQEKWIPYNLPEMFFTSAEKYPQREALIYKVGHHYEKMTYRKLENEIINLICGLKKLGLKSGDKAVIISENRPEWVITDLALTSIGMVNVPIHSVLSAAQLADIFREIRPKVVFFSDGETESKLLEISEEVSKIPHLISYEKVTTNGFTKLFNFKKIIDSEKVSEKEKEKIISDAKKVNPDSVASIIYTSGTSGHFKGVQLTHTNFIQNMLAVFENIWAYPEDRFFSVLPLSHVFERTAGYYVPIYSGSSIGYSLDITKISQEIKERKPTIVIAVPRLFEKIYEKIMAKVNSSLIKKLLFRIAFGVKKKNKNQRLIKIFDQIIFEKIRKEFGGEIRFFVSGGASLPEKIGKFFEQVGLVVLEGYGLTETSPVIAVNKLDCYKFGTVGLVLSNLDVKISEQGEILVKGPSVMKGYLKEEDNKKAFTEDGYFRTGDLGYFDRSGFLVITGRMKDLIVLTTGKKVAPVPIEEALEMSPYIEQSMVFGEARKHIGALIVPNFEMLFEKFGKERDKLLKDQEVYNFLAEEALNMTSRLASYEKIKKFVLLSELFSVDNGELTPKLSLRRHVIYARYQDLIEEIYC